jgi:hypothetical protein
MSNLTPPTSASSTTLSTTLSSHSSLSPLKKFITFETHLEVNVMLDVLGVYSGEYDIGTQAVDALRKTVKKLKEMYISSPLFLLSLSLSPLLLPLRLHSLYPLFLSAL